MKLTLTQYNKSYSIECKAEDFTLPQMRDEMLIPLLMAAGFHPETVKELFFDVEEPEIEVEFDDPVPPELD